MNGSTITWSTNKFTHVVLLSIMAGGNMPREYVFEQTLALIVSVTTSTANLNQCHWTMTGGVFLNSLSLWEALVVRIS